MVIDAVFKFFLSLLFICWGGHILLYATGIATTHPITMLGRMVAVALRASLRVLRGVFAILGLCFTTLGEVLDRLLE